MIYEERREATPNEAIALKAVVEPMLIRDSRIAMTNETMTELTGTFQPGFTCPNRLANHDRGKAKAIPIKNSHAPGKQNMASLHPSQKQKAGEMPWQHC